MASDKELTLGEYLRQEREHRCITIEQVASATKVGVKTLHALEENNYSELPAKPFIRGFVTSYCRFIGVEPKEVLTRFEDFINLKSNDRPNRDAGHSGYVFEKKDGEQQGRTILFIAIISFIALGGLAMLILKPSLKHHRNSHIDKLKAAHSGTPQTIASASPSPQVSPSAVPSPLVVKTEPSPAKPEVIPGKPGGNPDDPLDSGLALPLAEIQHKVVFKLSADMWVRYQVDERPIRKFIVRKGKTLILRAQGKIRIQVSKPDLATFNYNGQGPKSVANSGQESHEVGNLTLFFPPDLGEKWKESLGDGRPLPQISDSKPESPSPVPEASP